MLAQKILIMIIPLLFSAPIFALPLPLPLPALPGSLLVHSGPGRAGGRRGHDCHRDFLRQAEGPPDDRGAAGLVESVRGGLGRGLGSCRLGRRAGEAEGVEKVLGREA